jgi:thioredoxin-like negative regulator of GroEL
MAGSLALIAAAAPAQGVAVGQRAPGARVTTLDGTSANVRQFIGRTPVVIEFWAKWCGNCRDLAPVLHAAAEHYHNRVQFLTVAVPVDETPDDVARFARQHALAGTVLFDGEGKAVDAFNVPGTSFVLVVDRTGTVVYTGSGGTQDIEAAIRKAL